MKKWRFNLTALSLLVLSPLTLAANPQNWNSWVAGVREQALSEGISPATFDRAFSDIHEPSRTVKSLARSQPEHRLTFSKYLSSRADSYRIIMGRKQYTKNKELLENVGKDFGVDPCFIVAFWGMESSYGTYMGNFPVIKSLATLAYDSKRQDFFRK